MTTKKTVFASEEKSIGGEAVSKPRRVNPAGQNFRAKVELIEQWAQNGIPDGEVVPSTLKEFCSWESAAHGFSSWVKPNVTAPSGPYPTLRIRYDNAMALIARQETGESFKAQVEALTSLNRVLAVQNVSLSNQLRRLEEELFLLKRKIEK